MYTYADWHCDTASKIYETGGNLKDSDLHINLNKLSIYDSPIQIFAVWLKKEYYNSAYDTTVKIINNFKKEIMENEDLIEFSKDYNGVTKKNKKVKAMLSIEGAEALEGSIEKLHKLYYMGVRLVTLTWNYRNCVATGVMDRDIGGGLTEFGKSAVKEMEKLGIIVDVSHLSDEGFYDVARLAEKPFVASHSNCRQVCGSPRNLTDEQLKIISESGGVVGLNMYPPFLNSTGDATIFDVIKHTDHMLKICGDEHISFGCDFDGISNGPMGMEDVTCIENLISILKDNFGCDVAEKIAYKNYLRVLKAIM